MQQVFVTEEWVKNSRNETRAALDARDTAEAQLGALKDKQAQNGQAGETSSQGQR